MPWYASIELELSCPVCGRTTPPPAGVVPFRWGAIPERYRPRDEIRWWRDAAGRPIPPFHLVGAIESPRYNFGDPALGHVIAFDADPVGEYTCARCGASFEAIAVEIEAKRIARGLAFRAGECMARFGRAPDQLALVELAPDGPPIPHDEWIDVPLLPPVDRR